ncbi:MAG: transglutaminase-like domain-containing protein [Candidatus Methanosuratincola petrocarbonis]
MDITIDPYDNDSSGAESGIAQRPSGAKGHRPAAVLVAALAVLALVLGAAAGYMAVENSRLSQSAAEMTQALNSANAQISELTSEKTQLQASLSSATAQISELTSEKTQLQASLSSLRADYNSLKMSYDSLKADYGAVLDEYASLNQSVAAMDEALDSYAFLKASFRRVINDATVNGTASAVSAAGCTAWGEWQSYQKIYDYIKRNVEYVHDVEVPYISSYSKVNISDAQRGGLYLSGFTVDTFSNYVQSPEQTLDLGQGDCEDQAILAYAMMKYYMKYVLKNDHSLYLAHIEYYNADFGHLAVFIPVQGGNLCILDPAGSYLTKTWGTITSKPAAQELSAYSGWWSEYGGISQITLYSVSASDGSYRVASSGTLSQVAAFLSS